MRTAREIYEKYRVPPWLQLHQVRVTAVGKMICDARDDADTDLVIKACLLHDIGAIVKFDFTGETHSVFRGHYQPDELPHWREVQRDMIARYGAREHDATRAVLAEIGDASIIELFNTMGFEHMDDILRTGNLSAQIAQYGDMRVGPGGIVSLSERLTDVLERYAQLYVKEGREEEAKKYPALAYDIESNIFREASIRPHDITDVAAAPLIKELWDYEIA